MAILWQAYFGILAVAPNMVADGFEPSQHPASSSFIGSNTFPSSLDIFSLQVRSNKVSLKTGCKS